MPGSSAPLITVPLPTVTGREQFYEQAVSAYERWANVEILTFKDFPGCGPAWALGAFIGKGDYIHFGADDVEMHQGWWQAATQVCDKGKLPAPLIFNTNGSLQACGGSWERMEKDGEPTSYTRGPFVSRQQWEQLAPLVAPFLATAHYYTDNIFTWAAGRLGVPTVNCHGYAYTHHMAGAGRLDGREGVDGNLYTRYVESF